MKHLITDIIPDTYNLYINLDLNSTQFNGENIVNFNCIKETNIIQFHSLDLLIESVFLNNNNVNLIKNTQLTTYDPENDINTIKLNNNLQIGQHTLKIKFSGQYSQGAGLVKNINHSKNRILFFTRFEPNFSRKAFPCWDEPNFKVKYNMKIEINDKSYQVLFNTDPINIKTTNNNVIYSFEETVPMPTYVMSFMVGKFYFIEQKTKNNVRLRVYIPSDRPNSNHLGLVALDYGIKIMDFCSEYFNSPYPFNKLDFVPIDNVDAKGMENYGLIFYDLPFLLFDKSSSTIEHLIGIVAVIAHEIAHQWFGNLVTMSKWNELWLKESFAKFFEYYIIDNICPEWDIKSKFIKNLFRTFEFDSISLKSVKIDKIENKQIMQIYDDITYFKGATMLSMIQDYIGKDKFKISIQKYLNKHKFGNTTVDNFIESLIEQSNNEQKQYINHIIKTYTEIKGTPIINFDSNEIKIIPFNTRKIINNIIKNKQFNANEKNKWTIPLKIKQSENNYSFTIIKSGKYSYKYNELNLNIQQNIQLNEKKLVDNLVDNALDQYKLDDNTSNQDKLNQSKVDNSSNQDKFDISQFNIINNKSVGYYRFCYSNDQFMKIINNINNIDHHQLISILNDVYILSVYNLCSFKYFMVYTLKLIEHLKTINDPFKHNFYLVSSIYSYINNINSFFDEFSVKNIYDQKYIDKAKQNYKNILKNQLKQFTKHLTAIFDVFNIDNYVKNDLFSNKIQYNSLLLFLLQINKSKSEPVISYLLKNKLFNISGDLNAIIIKYIVQKNDLKKLIEIKEIYPDMEELIISSLKYTKNKVMIKKILNQYFIDKTIHLTFDEITQLLGGNKYFLSVFTEYFIDQYEEFIKIIPLDSKGFTRILNSLILNQTDPILIEQILNKLESINNKQYAIKLTQSKNILFNKLFVKINIIKLLNELNTHA